MKIIILGAGQVGGTLAEHLASEANDITVVDTDAERLRGLGDRLDIRTVQGRASFPTVLRQAGADDADMLVAVTNSDETNMVACQVAHTLFHTPTEEEIRAKSDGSDFLHQSADEEAEYMMRSIRIATNFVQGLVKTGRGFIYLIR